MTKIGIVVADEQKELYSVDGCALILKELNQLLLVFHKTEHQLAKLKDLIDKHMGGDDKRSEQFRSFCCFGHNDAPVSLDLFNQLCILPSTDWQVSLYRNTAHDSIEPISLSATAINKLKLDSFVSATDNVRQLFGGIRVSPEFHKDQHTITAGIPSSGISPSWTSAILGLKTNSTYISLIPPTSVLRERITCSLKYSLLKKKEGSGLFRFFCSESGSAWQRVVDNSFDVNAFYLKACSEFPAHLDNMMKEENTTLDKLAGVVPAQRYLEVEAIVADMYCRANNTGMESADLPLEDGTLGGTVFAMHNGMLSAEWVASYLVDTDNNAFMKDHRAEKQSNKSRLLRVYSTNHSHGEPNWLQFGETSGVYLFLSQRASAAEEGWLKIGSYVINLLIEMINKKLDVEGFHPNANKRYMLEKVVYDMGVANLAHPVVGNYAYHHDVKEGMLHPQIRAYLPFFMCVPTFAVQNHCAPSTTISWRRVTDSTNTLLASFTQDFLMMHFQLFNVQTAFKHGVGISSL
jgi:hypothetical protein